MTRVAPGPTLALALAVLLLSLVAAGCPGDIEYVQVFPAGCQAEPVFVLLSPNPDGTSVFTGDNMLISVDVGNFNIVNKPGEPNADCEGHFHVSLDEGPISLMLSTSETKDISDLSDGEHSLRITVHNNDHSRIEEIDALTATFVRQAGTN